jgi:hypothetical protein
MGEGVHPDDSAADQLLPESGIPTLRLSNPQSIMKAGLTRKGAAVRVHEAILCERSRVCHAFRRATVGMGPCPSIPAPFWFDDETMKDFVKLLYGECRSSLAMFDESGVINIDCLAGV